MIKITCKMHLGLWKGLSLPLRIATIGVPVLLIMSLIGLSVYLFLELRDTQAQLSETQAQLDIAINELSITRVRLEQTENELNETKLQLRQVQSQLEEAKKNFPELNTVMSGSQGITLTNILNELKRAQDIRMQNQPLGDREVEKLINSYTGMDVYFTDPISSISTTGVSLMPSSYIASNVSCKIGNDSRLLTLRRGDNLSISGRISEIDEGWFGSFTIYINNCTIHW